MPKANINLPLYFKGNNKFYSNKITILSILLFLYIGWNSLNNLLKVGDIQNVMLLNHPNKNNIDIES